MIMLKLESHNLIFEIAGANIGKLAVRPIRFHPLPIDIVAKKSYWFYVAHDSTTLTLYRAKGALTL
jgi:hypothetical protein